MKKLSIFLSAVLVFMMVATSIGTPQTVEAFPYSQINQDEFMSSMSGKAGTEIYISCSLSYYAAPSLDVTGWKGALCPVNNQTLAGAVATVEFTNTDKRISSGGAWQYASLSRNMVLEQDIPDGIYVKVIFDAQGNVYWVSEEPIKHITKQRISLFGCDVMNNDGYVYAYVYADNVALNAYAYPTLYAADKTTALTTYSDYTVIQNEWGNTVHVYRLNMLNPAEFQIGADSYATYLYYTMGTDAYGNELSIYWSDANNIGYTAVMDANKTAADYGMEPVNPFEGNADDGAENNVTGLATADGNNWYLYENGVINTNYTGLYCDANLGWWLVQNGQVAFDYNGLYGDAVYGWWLVNGGKVNFDYTGLYCDANLGWWLIGGGAVCFDYNGLWGDPVYGWWLVNGGKVNFDYTGLYCDANFGWWLVGGGAVCFEYNGLWDDPQQGWWMINGGAPAFGYTGLAENANGWWYVENGTINFNYTGQVPFNNGTYNVVGGYVVF